MIHQNDYCISVAIHPPHRSRHPQIDWVASPPNHFRLRWSIAQLAGLSGPKEAIRHDRIILAGAIYVLETGRVRFLTQQRSELCRRSERGVCLSLAVRGMPDDLLALEH
jgi:hypothetical protein